MTTVISSDVAVVPERVLRQRANALADRLELGARALANFASGLTDAACQAHGSRRQRDERRTRQGAQRRHESGGAGAAPVQPCRARQPFRRTLQFLRSSRDEVFREWAALAQAAADKRRELEPPGWR